MTHFAILKDRVWTRLCGAKAGEYLNGPLVPAADISCPVCLKKWNAGMRKVRRMFRTYRGEE